MNHSEFRVSSAFRGRCKVLGRFEEFGLLSKGVPFDLHSKGLVPTEGNMMDRQTELGDISFELLENSLC